MKKNGNQSELLVVPKPKRAPSLVEITATVIDAITPLHPDDRLRVLHATQILLGFGKVTWANVPI